MSYREIFSYGVFGVLTTVVNFVTYWMATRLFRFGIVAGSLIGWFVSVGFAYVTNRRFVFRSDGRDVLKEVVQFYSGRILTGLLDVVLMYVLAHGFGVGDLYGKVFVNGLVIVLNYVFGRLVFKGGA